MNTRPLRSRVRAAAILLPALMMAMTVSVGARAGKGHVSAARSRAPQSYQGGPKIWLQDSQALGVTHVAADGTAQNKSAAQGLAAGQGQPLSMIHGDFDQDGVEDLAVGYATPGGGAIVVHRGNLDAFAPQSDASFQAIGRGEFPPPFLPQARVFSIPIRPDFLAAGSFTGNGNTDLVAASQGGNALYVFPGDGKGNFSQPQIFNLSGAVHALAAGNLGNGQAFTNLVVGISNSQKSFSLLVLGGTGVGFGALASYPLSALASNIEFGAFGGPGQDAAFLSGGQVFILRSSPMQVVKVSLPVSASAFALGSFLFDRNGGSQIALLGSDGSIQIAARNEFDPRAYTNEEFRAIRQARLRNETPPLVPPTSFPVNGWRIVESFPSIATVALGQAPAFFRTRVSNNGADDIMWISASMGRMAVISHPDLQPGAPTFLPGQISFRPYSGSPVAALPMRINVDARPGVVALHQAQVAPAIVMPIPDPTFTVNRFDDPVPTAPIANACTGGASSCSLREAILKSNGDTVMVPAGTYTLTIAKMANDCTGAFGALSAEHNVTIVGTVDGGGNPTSIIQAGTTAYNAGTPDGVDMVMNVNEDLGTLGCPITSASASLTNLILQNGHNRGTHGVDGDGGCMEFDTGSAGTATLTLTNVRLQNCDTTQGSGGGLANFNFVVATGTGQAIISNSIIQGNSVADNSGGSPTAAGGGIWVSDSSRMTMTNSQVLNNLAIKDTATTGIGSGGGLLITSVGTVGQTPQTQIHSSTISGNQSALNGGGISDSANLLIDQGTIISGNKNGQNGAGAANGGGLFVNPASGLTATLSKVTITGNTSTGTGGGIATGAIGAGPVTINFSRLAGNTAASTGSNLENLGSTTTATNNWWGTNTASTTIHTTAGTTTFDPFIVLTHTPSPDAVGFNGIATLTADFLHDNHRTGILLSSIDVLLGLPITFNNPVLGTLSSPQATIRPSGTATATFTAGTTAGAGSADAVVDNGTATANITVAVFVVAKVFGAATIPLNGTTSLSFTITNSDAVNTATGIAFTDNLPAGLVVATPGNLTGNCGGTASAADGSSTVSLTGGTLAPSTSCTISVNVTGTTSGVKNNSVTVTSTTPGGGNTSNASITVVGPPTISKAFNPTSIPLNGTSTLTFTFTNPNATDLTGIAATDVLPAGLTVSNGTTPNICNGTGTGTATGGNTLTLTGASLAGGASCSFPVTVTGTAAGLENNTTGTVSAIESGMGLTASASLTVVAPPSLAKAFNPTTIALNGTTSLTFTIANPAANTVAEAGVAFTDTLPTGLVVSTPNGLSNTCGGTATAVAGSTSISLTGGSIAVNTSCTVVVNVTGTASGQYTNTSGAVSSTNGGTGNTASANLTVAAPPTITKSFNPTQIALNANSTLSFTITNPNTGVALNGVAFTDNLPAGLVVAATPNVTGSCGSGTVTAVAGSGSISLSGGTLTASPAAGSSCTFSVGVTGTTAGVKNNSTQVTSTEGGTGNTTNASITVVAPPGLTKSFGATSIALGGSTSLTFTVNNPNSTVGLSGIGFSDTLPGGLIISTPNGLSSTCSGTITATQATSVISLSGASLAASGSCSFSVNVTGTAVGQQNNTSGTITSVEGGTGGTASASIAVVTAPAIAKAFNPGGIPPNGVSTLTITITNPPANTVQENGVAFTDNFPANLVVATPNGLTNACGGTATAVAGSGSVSLTGGTVAVNSSCMVTVNVSSSFTGMYLNSTGPVSSTNGGTGGAASATLFVAFPPTISDVFVPDTIVQGGTTVLSFTINNPNSNSTPPNADMTLTGIAFTDNLPGGLVVAASPSVSNDCGGTVTAVPGSSSISLAGGSLNPAVGLISRLRGPSRVQFQSQPAANGSCFISVQVKPNSTGTFNNTSGPITSDQSGPGAASNTASLTVNPPPNPPTITKAFGAASIPLNGITSLTFNFANPNSSTAFVNISVSDTLPSGLVVANPNGLAGSCVGSADITANPGSSTTSMAALNLPANGSCSFSVNVTGTTAGTKNNTSGNVTATFDDGTGTFVPISGGTASASTVVVGPPSMSKAFNPVAMGPNNVSTLSFTITNPAGNSVPETGIAFTDTLPANLVVATPNGLTNTCGGTATATAGSGSVILSGVTLAAGASCTSSVNVTSSVIGVYNNSTMVTSTNGGNGNTASATLTVGPALSITEINGPQVVPDGTPGIFVMIVTVLDPTLVSVNLNCSNLPSGAACNFNPPTVNQVGPTQVVLTISTTANVASVFPGSTGKTAPVYAVLLFPLLGLAGIFAGGRKSTKARLRMGIFFVGLLGVLAFAGCQGATGTRGTPRGSFPVSVTATSSAKPSVQASTTVILTVQ